MNTSIERIHELRQNLAFQGYNKYQIQEIIEECIGEKSLDTLNDLEVKSVICCLEEYICFAQKCKRPICR